MRSKKTKLSIIPGKNKDEIKKAEAARADKILKTLLHSDKDEECAEAIMDFGKMTEKTKLTIIK